MAVFLYDGSFESLMGLCGNLIKRDEVPDDIVVEGKEENVLFGESVYPSIDDTAGKRIIDAVENKSVEALRYICGAFLSEINGSEKAIFDFLSLIHIKGWRVIDNLAEDSVLSIFRMQQKVFIEKHRMLGLLRFSELSDGTFYSPYEPDHNITCLVAPHFKERLAQQNWIIHDVKRNIGAMYKKQTGRWELFNIEQSSRIRYSEREEDYQKLWHHYCREISIPERKNPRCQKQFMPVRYWKHLTERQQFS
jgi:probable DNA metabolism protein